MKEERLFWYFSEVFHNFCQSCIQKFEPMRPVNSAMRPVNSAMRPVITGRMAMHLVITGRMAQHCMHDWGERMNFAILRPHSKKI